MISASDNESKPTSIRLSIENYNKIKKEAEKDKRSISKQIEFVIEKYYKIKDETN